MVALQLSANTPYFIRPQYWPTKNLDPNLVDSAVWGILQDSVYCYQIRDVDHLKERLIYEWCRFDQPIIDRAVGQWWQRLLNYPQKGGLFDHQI